jgi:ATP-dependent DNA helicase RecG
VPSNQVDAALNADPAAVGPLLLTAPEDQWFDRKSATVRARDLARPLVAFANAEGGTIVVGLYNRVVQGIAANGQRVNEWRQAPVDFTRPPVRARFEEVPCVNHLGGADQLLVIRVEPGERVHEAADGECYLRIGDESRKLTYSHRHELEYDRGQSQYDGEHLPGVDFSHLDAPLVRQYGKKIGSTADVRRILSARSLLTLEQKITNAGYLLFGKRPQDAFPQAHVRILRFLDSRRGTGARLELEESSDLRVEGPIPRVVEEAQRLLEELVPRRRSLAAASGRFEGAPIVPRDAWLEGLVNAVIHRSYSLAGDHVRVEVYPDRIEIESPGRFPGLVDPRQPLKISRFARNPRIARVCADLRIGQELGEGIRRMFEEMRRVGLTDPVYRQTSGSVRLVLAALPRLDPALAARLPRGSSDVIDLLRSSGGPLGTGDIVDALNVSRPVILRRLGALQEEGLVRWVGKTPKDPRAVWLLTDR